MKCSYGIATPDDSEDFLAIYRMFYLFFIFSILWGKCSNPPKGLKSVLFLVGYKAGGLKNHPPRSVQSSHRENKGGSDD